ncbi:MAG: ribosomal L7Ae/L30e/S12e/Gadd45 family protein [Clostridia bacterium]|nr:ribosomal L7Ae/L30e/S12e/Gadd45 family protein [Clostridia bacterium]
MMDEKIYSFIGLATKAGKLLSGEDACERALKAGKTYLIIVSEDASDNTKKKFSDACRYRGNEIRFFGEKVLLGRYTGKELRSVIAIIENGFAKRLIEMIDGKYLQFGGE